MSFVACAHAEHGTTLVNRVPKPNAKTASAKTSPYFAAKDFDFAFA